MTSPENQSDQYLDDVLAGKSSEVDLAQDEAQLLDDLVQVYQPETLSAERKHTMWKNAQLPAEKPKRQAKRTRWIWRIAAGLTFIIGLFAFKLYQDMRPESIEVQTDYSAYDNGAALFKNPPAIFEYGGYANIFGDFLAAPLMHDAGMQWVGMMLSMEPNARGQNLLDDIQIAHENNFKIYISLRGPSNIRNFDEERFRAEFAAYARDIAAAGADAIEIMSEANLDQRVGRLLSAESYAAILSETAQAIREGNPDTLIISGAPAPTGAEDAFPQQIINDDHFLRDLVVSGALDYVDCVGMQYLEGTVEPTASSGDVRDNHYSRYLPTMIDTYRDIIGEDKPICITELGYYSGEALDEVPEAWQWGAHTSRQAQQHFLSNSIAYLSRQNNVLLAMIWHIDYLDLRPEGRAYALIYPYEFEAP